MPVNATGRKYESDLIKAVDNYHEESAVRFNFETVDVEGSGDIDNIGVPLKWSDTDSAFLVFAAPDDWAASTVTAVGDVVKPSTRDGNEYVCTVAGTTNDTEGEPTWVTTIGGVTTETDGVVWTARKAYAQDPTSPLPNKASICVTDGTAFGRGFNKADTTLSGTAVQMTVLYRGEATLINEGFEWGGVAAADQAEFLTALEDQRINTISNAEVVTPTYTS